MIPPAFQPAPEDRKWWLIAVSIVAAIFLLLENKYWVPGGDSEVYLGSAINLVKGHGYLFNGQATHIAPPGWPWVLALLLKISPTFLFLKLATLFCMWAGLATYYWVLRRFASPMLCAAAIVLTALISHVYSLTFWLHSDALFVWITASTLLICLQISEGRAFAWRCALLTILCILAVLNRWAAVANVVPVVAALLSGEWRPKWNRRWVVSCTFILLTFITFFAVKRAVRYFSPPTVPYQGTASVDAAQLPPPEVGDSGNVAEAPGLITGTSGRSGYATRFLGFGTWFSFLLWQPFRMAGGLHIVWWTATICGWIVFAYLVAGATEATRRHHWLPASVLLYVIGICMNWPQANARYLVPIAPLLVLLIFVGLRDRPRWTDDLRWQRQAWLWIGRVGVASILFCNAALYAVEVSVARSSNFADRYETGIDKNLVSAARLLVERGAGDWQVCVNPLYRNLNKKRTSPTGLRVISLLTGKAVQEVPAVWFKDPKIRLPTNTLFRKQYIARNKVRYYLEQPEVSPWRVWHFRMAWLQQLMSESHSAPETDSGWRLFRCTGAETPIEVLLPRVDHFPTRVPGL